MQTATKIEIKGRTYEVEGRLPVGENTRRLGMVESICLKGKRGAFYSAYRREDGSLTDLVRM